MHCIFDIAGLHFLLNMIRNKTLKLNMSVACCSDYPKVFINPPGSITYRGEMLLKKSVL